MLNSRYERKKKSFVHTIGGHGEHESNTNRAATWKSHRGAAIAVWHKRWEIERCIDSNILPNARTRSHIYIYIRITLRISPFYSHLDCCPCRKFGRAHTPKSQTADAYATRTHIHPSKEWLHVGMRTHRTFRQSLPGSFVSEQSCPNCHIGNARSMQIIWWNIKPGCHCCRSLAFLSVFLSSKFGAKWRVILLILAAQIANLYFSRRHFLGITCDKWIIEAEV